MPKELAKDTVIHAYLLKDGNSNAFMMPFGIMFVNIGLFNDLESEAALAAVMAHELAHYYLKHSLNQYVKAERGEFERVFRKTNYSKFSINNELQADSLAIVWMNQSGYGIKGISEVFKSIQRIEKQMSLLYSTDVELEESTHPFSERRLAQVDSFARVHGENLGKDFIVSQKDFWNFKKKAISEALKHLLHNFQYKSCINQAFKFHILDVDNPEYVYYLMEAIRRICYFNSDVWKNKFITDDYASILKKQLGDKKVKMEDHLFKKLPVDILCLSDNEVNNVQAGFYWEGEPRFTTYEEAFEFFSQIGELLKEPECTLSHAIKVGFDTSAQKKLLQKYLAFEHIQFRDFATHLLNGTIQSSLQDKILCVLSDFYTTVRHGSEEIYIRNEKLTGDNNPTALIEAAVKDFTKRSALNLAELQQHHNNDYVLFRDLKSVSLRTLFAKGEKTLLYELDPRFWELMAAYQTNEIEFVDLSFYEVRKAEYGLASYKETISFDINDLLFIPIKLSKKRFCQKGRKRDFVKNSVNHVVPPSPLF